MVNEWYLALRRPALPGNFQMSARGAFVLVIIAAGEIRLLLEQALAHGERRGEPVSAGQGREDSAWQPPKQR